MIKTILILCFLISALLLLACSKTEPTGANTATAPANKTAPAASTPATSTASNTEKTGVAECDNFLTAYEDCVHNKVPATAQAQFNQGMAEWRKQWHALAANPQTKPALLTACKNAIETTRASMKPYGCTF